MNNPAKKLHFWVLILILLGFAVELPAQQSEEKRAFVYASRLMADKMYDLAADQFLEYAKKYPNSPRAAEAQFSAGQCLMHEKKYHRSIQAFQALILRYAQFQRLDEAQLGIADAYFNLQLFRKAAESYENLPLYYPKSVFAPKALMLAADMYRRIGNSEKSRELWIRVIKEYPGSDLGNRARLKVAGYYEAKGDLSTALRYLDRLVESGDVSVKAEVLLRKGAVLEKMGRVTDAQNAYRQVLGLKPVPPEKAAGARLQLGLLDVKLGNWREANTQFKASLSLGGSGELVQKAQVHLAKSFFVLGDYPDALRYYQKTARAAADSSLRIQALLGAALSSEKMLDFEGAIRFLETITSLHKFPESAVRNIRTAYLHLLDDFLKLKKTTSARETILQFLKEFPKDVYRETMEFRLANLDEKDRNAPAQALDEYENFLRTFPRSAWADEATLGKARCLEKLGRTEQAFTIYRQFAANFPGSPLLPDVRRHLNWYNKFLNTNLQGSVKQLANLMGLVLLNKGREDALYALFKLNYEQLKDYRNVVSLGHLILKTNAAAHYSQEILFYLGRAYQMLAEYDSTGAQSIAFKDSSKAIYRRFLTRYPTHTKAPDAQFQLIRLQSPGLSPLRRHQDYLALVTAYPLGTNRPEIYFDLGKTLIEASGQISADSLGRAQIYFKKAFRLDPKSIWADGALFYLAELRMRQKDPVLAVKDLKDYIRKFPQGEFIVKANYILAKLYGEQGQPKKALGLFETIQREFYYTDYSDSALAELSELYLRLKKYDRALQVLDRVEKLHPERKNNILFKRGFILYRQGKSAAAVLRLREYIANDPAGAHVPEALKIMADISNQSGDPQQALEIYRLVLESSQRGKPAQTVKPFLVRLKIANILFAMQKYKMALRNYNLLLEQNPNEMNIPDVRAKKILCLIYLGKVETAQKELSAFRKSYKGINTYLGQIYYEFGNYYVRQKNFDRAMKNYKLVAGKYKRTKWRPYGEYGEGRVYLVTNKIEKALKILTRMPRKYPKSSVLPLVYLNLGDFYYKSKQFENALSAFKNVLTSAPSRETKKTAMKYVLKVYSDLGMWDSALRASRQYIQAFPNGSDVFDQKIQTGIYYVRLEEYEQAINYFRKLLPEADTETEAEIQYWIGESYFKMGQFERSISEFLKVRYMAKPTKLPWDVTAEYEAGLAYLKLNKPQKAKAIFRKIVNERGAGSDYGKVALKRIREIEAGK